jgi:hypothetical protein
MPIAAFASQVVQGEDGPVKELAKAYLALRAERERERAHHRALARALLEKAGILEALREGPIDWIDRLLVEREQAQAFYRQYQD